ncbi:MAG TPA: type II toxin-antitoxin system prevent-host-death family antitoxin [Alicycliphilus denitrificans]|nr:type II toxin-antitoxin system prevent-host-death family antitoxin [Alicycliphilus denitrificans]
MPLTVNVHEAKTQFSRLLEQAHAGQEIILAKAGKPYARLVPLAPDEGTARKPGRLSGKRLPDGFFDPLPPEELAAWE